MRLLLQLCVVVIAAGARGEGITLSLDGRVWLAGCGEYNEGRWGEVGQGISVPQGGTFYIKYYSGSSAGRALHFAPYGAKWGGWGTLGPALTAANATSSTKPVILKLSEAGTPRSTVTWVNGDGAWLGLTHEGAYNLGLHGDALWVLPPITISKKPSAGFWANLLRPLKSDPTRSTSSSDGGRVQVVSVADAGNPAALVGVTLLAGALAWRIARWRQLRQRK